MARMTRQRFSPVTGAYGEPWQCEALKKVQAQGSEYHCIASTMQTPKKLHHDLFIKSSVCTQEKEITCIQSILCVLLSLFFITVIVPVEVHK